MNNVSPGKGHSRDDDGEESEARKDSALVTDDSLLEQELEMGKSDIISDVSSDIVS